MLRQEQLEEIKRHLEQAKNPLFFYDDDHDGLASYLLLQRAYPRGHGVCVKAALHDERVYIKKIQLYKPDKVFFLDRATLTQELLNDISVPAVWIDHHQPVQRERVFYYNPMVPDLKDNRPTSHWCYQVVRRDEWIAAVGIVGDWHIPEFSSFAYEELFDGRNKQPELLYESRIGTLVRVFNFILKGKNSETKKCVRLLLKIENPYEILRQETPRGAYIYQRYESVNKEYQKLLQRALRAHGDDELFMFVYPSTRMSFTGELSNELLYRLDKKLIVIAREKGSSVRVSLRSSHVKVLPLLKNALEGLDGYGGGHDYACGANLQRDDFPRFIEQLREALTKK